MEVKGLPIHLAKALHTSDVFGPQFPVVHFEGKVYQFLVPKGFGGERKKGWHRAWVSRTARTGTCGYCSVRHEYGARVLISSGLWLTGKA